MIRIGDETRLNGGNVNLVEYEETSKLLICSITSYVHFKGNYLAGKTPPEGKIDSNQAVKNPNTTHQVIFFDGSQSSDPAGTIRSTRDICGILEMGNLALDLKYLTPTPKRIRTWFVFLLTAHRGLQSRPTE